MVCSDPYFLLIQKRSDAYKKGNKGIVDHSAPGRDSYISAACQFHSGNCNGMQFQK